MSPRLRKHQSFWGKTTRWFTQMQDTASWNGMTPKNAAMRSTVSTEHSGVIMVTVFPGRKSRSLKNGSPASGAKWNMLFTLWKTSFIGGKRGTKGFKRISTMPIWLLPVQICTCSQASLKHPRAYCAQNAIAIHKTMQKSLILAENGAFPPLFSSFGA